MATNFTGIESSLSPYAGPYVSEMLGRGQALASMPYQAYEGQLTAGPSALQTQAFQGLGGLGVPQASMAGSFTGSSYVPPTAQEAVDGQYAGIGGYDMSSGAFTPASGQVVDQYMTPFLEGALQPQYDAARRQADIAQQGLQSRYGKAGAFGGSRQTIAETELERGLLDRMAGITGAGYQDAFEQAQNQFNTEQGYGLRALAAQQAGGAQQRAMDQEAVMADIAQFETERDDPFRKTQYMQSLLQGLPISTQSYQYAAPTNLQSFSGGAGSILDLLERFDFLS